MSITATKLLHPYAWQLAKAFIDDVEVACERIEICGSIRRRRAEVGDIEILCVPRAVSVAAKVRDGDLLGVGEELLLDSILGDLCGASLLKKLKGGERYQQFSVLTRKEPVMLDLFRCDKDNWGLQLLIRTGPEAFSKQIVTPRRKGGLLPGHLQIRNGFRIYDTAGQQVACPEERQVFELFEMKYVEPWDRK